jgi:hypothetical protein
MVDRAGVHPPLHLVPFGAFGLVHVRHVGLGRHAESTVDVHADDALGRHPRHRGRHIRPEVAALRAEALVAEAVHQLRPHPGDPVDREARGGRRLRESEARHRRHDDVERAGQCADQLGELHNGVRPPVREDQR